MRLKYLKHSAVKAFCHSMDKRIKQDALSALDHAIERILVTAAKKCNHFKTINGVEILHSLSLRPSEVWNENHTHGRTY